MRFADIEIGAHFTREGATRWRKVSATEAVPVPRTGTVGEAAPVGIEPGEQVDFVLVKKEADDPLALRASVGGNDTTGFYCVYRGDISAVADMLEKVLADLRERNTTEGGTKSK